MVDSIQRQSSIPLPTYQTGQGATNPTTTGSARQTNDLESNAKTTMRDQDTDGFADYLDSQQQTTELKAAEKTQSPVFDPVKELEAGSVYGATNGRPIGT